MTGPSPGRSVFRWWTPSTGEVRLMLREVQERIGWQVGVRWVFVTVGAVGTLLAALGNALADIRPELLGGVTAALALTNVVYSSIAPWVQQGFFRHFSPRAFLLTQSTTDFAILGALSYVLGIIETPIAALFLAHISLLTLHCAIRQSLYMTLVAGVFASAPVVLVGIGVLPPQSILGSDLGARLTENGALISGYVIGIFLIFLTYWYLVAQLANGLRIRERRLQDDYDRLVQVGELKVRATLRATHELKAPLAAIKSYVYTMRDGYTGPLAPSTRLVVLRIGERCDLLMERISQIIHLANLKTLEQSELAFKRLDLIRIASDEIDDAAIRGRARHVTVALSPDSVVEAQIMASEAELRTMLSNILTNAVTYSHQRGEVTVSVTADDAGVHCAVHDRGIGIPPECLDRIFEDHFRTDHAVKHRPNGSGLGMAIVAEVVRLHEAQIVVTSQLGRSTTMTVTFPPPERFIPSAVHRNGGPHGPNPDDRRRSGHHPEPANDSRGQRT